MTDITTQIRALNVTMLEKHEDEKFRVAQLGAHIADRNAELNRDLAEIHARHARSRAETRRLLHMIAAEVGVVPAAPRQVAPPAPAIGTSPGDAADLPALIRRARAASDAALEGVAEEVRH